jgi:methionine synthase II (cobalamin-independent)
MENDIYQKFSEFLNELQTILKQLNNSGAAMFQIDSVMAELEKPKVDRDCFLVKSNMKKLEEVVEIKDLLNKSKHVAEFLCYNKA